MAATLRISAVMAIITSFVTAIAAASGAGTTTRYWDCCKPSCAWNDLDRLGTNSPVTTCDVNDDPLSDSTVQSGCAGGGAYMCSDQTPWEVSPDLAYGFAAVSSTKSACCQCYQLTFTSGPVQGKRMIVQATNTGGDVASTQFDIAIPGGGMGAYDGCSQSWGATPLVWGAKFGGAATNDCASMPSKLQPGCSFRWAWFQGADNPTVDWEEVACPAAITAKSGCSRNGDSPAGNQPLAVFSAKVYAATVPALPSSTAAAAAQPPKSTPRPKQHDAQSTTTHTASAPAAHTADATSHAAARKFTAATTFRTLAMKTSSTEEARPAETGNDDTCEL